MSALTAEQKALNAFLNTRPCTPFGVTASGYKGLAKTIKNSHNTGADLKALEKLVEEAIHKGLIIVGGDRHKGKAYYPKKFAPAGAR